jgi:hypothetical protein
MKSIGSWIAVVVTLFVVKTAVAKPWLGMPPSLLDLRIDRALGLSEERRSQIRAIVDR